MFDWIHDALLLNVDLIRSWGYPGVFFLMFVESSFIPFPSEVVVPPAGFLAARGEMDATAVMAAAIAGSLAGAYLNYLLAARLGRPFFHRHGRWFLVKERSLDRAEAFFARHGEIGTFLGRLVPGVRQLVSLPAGMARMHAGRFGLFTGLGAGIWCAILLGVGWTAGRHGGSLDLAVVRAESGRIFLHWICPAAAAILLVYVAVRRRRAARAPSPGGEPVGDRGP